VIVAQARKLEALKAHKRGLMQQIFPREGETVPRLRFPEFRDAPEWEVRELGELCEILNNRRVPIASAERRSGPYPYYGASGVVDYVDDYLFDERLLLVGEDGAKWGAFETTAFIAQGRYWVNNHAHVLRPIGVVDTLLEACLTMRDLGAYVTGHAPPKLTLAKLKSILVTFPRSEAEQRGIAECLSSQDERIAAESTWRSRGSGATYPMGWTIEIPSLKIRLRLTPLLEDQELVTKASTQVTYWEGAVDVSGSLGNISVRGAGYVEMTGYDRPFRQP
jgi:type I restriction enzyme S subunit